MLYTRKMHLQWTGAEVSRCVISTVNDESVVLGLLRIGDDDTDLTQFEGMAIEAEQDLAPFRSSSLSPSHNRGDDL